MARDPRTDRINTFIVEMDSEGVEVEHRCHFMGLRALANAQLSFHDVKVPRENLIGEEGDGLKIALVTLNTGRLSLPAVTSGASRVLLETCRKWCQARVQWGVPIGKHEAIAHHLADMAGDSFALTSVAELLGDLADRDDRDIRLEAAAAKYWNTETQWRMVDTALQVRGGRGFETERSLAARGEPAVGIERMMRDARINLIFEGSSEVMHLFMAREAVDRHLSVAGDLVDPKASAKKKLAALPRIVAFYAKWYPRQWLGWSWWPRHGEMGRFAEQMRFAERSARRLARKVFHGMLRYRAKMERKQAFLFRAVDVAIEVFVLTATLERARRLKKERAPEAKSAERVALTYARGARRRINALLRGLFDNDDAARTRLGRRVMDDELTWMEQGVMRLPYSVDDLGPPTVGEMLGERERASENATSPAA